MKLHYDRETDSLYIELVETASVDSREVVPGVVIDLDAQGNPVGIDIDRASTIVNLTALDAETIPADTVSLPKNNPRS